MQCNYFLLLSFSINVVVLPSPPGIFLLFRIFPIASLPQDSRQENRNKRGDRTTFSSSALVWSGFPSFLSYFLFTLVTTLLRSPSLNWNGTMVPYLRLTKIQNWAKQSSMVNNKTHPRTFTRKMRYMNHQNNYGRAK